MLMGKYLLALIATLLLLSAFTASSAISAAIPVQEKLSGERPQFGFSEQWKYNFTLKNITGGTSITTTIHANTTGITSRVTNDYYENVECYILHFMPFDPLSVFWLQKILREVDITDFGAEDLLKMGNSSVLEVYVSKDNFSWVQTTWTANYSEGSGGKRLHVIQGPGYPGAVWTANESYSYMCFNFSLSTGKDFGHFTDDLNISMSVYCDYYNASGYYTNKIYPGNLSNVSGEFSISFPYTYLFYPRFNVTGVETVTVAAGTYECWKMKIILTTNGDGVIGYLWYSPEVKNYVKLDMNVTVESVDYNVCVELASYSGQVSPVSPPSGLSLLASLIIYSAYQGQQQRNIVVLSGVAVVVVAGVSVMIFVARRRRT